ncbi:hypothetical protein HYY74_06830 [Candidatus Woesearchaeota archaeon]|nr:hypothetical protein [Candidatus Woesearchaeota archaeon]
MKWPAFAILALMTLAGCKSGDGSPSLPVSYSAIHSGTEGIKIEFLPNGPPENLQAGEEAGVDYKISLKISNKGAADVDSGLLAIIYNPDYIRVEDASREVSLLGRGPANPPGTVIFEFFSSQTLPFTEVQSKKRETKITAVACYRYSTESLSDTCIDADLLNINMKQKACVPKSLAFSGQGAPVAVVKIEPEMLPDGSGSSITAVRPQYTVHIKNVGLGQVVSGEAVQALCTEAILEPRALNMVGITASLSEKGLDCSPNPVRLESGEGKVRCIASEAVPASTPSYNTPLLVKLSYGYMSSESKKVTITKTE